MQQATAKKTAWYDDLFVVLILLVVFWPLGVYALFRGTASSPSTKYVLAGFTLAIVGTLIFAYITR